MIIKSSLVFFGVVALASCNFLGRGEQSSSGDSISGSDEAASLVADSIFPDLEAVKVFKPRIQKINNDIHYKASTRQKIYSTAHYELQWPVDAPGYDISSLQRAICEWLFSEKSTNINAVMKKAGLQWFKDAGGGEVTWTEVETREKSDDNSDSNSEEIFFWGEPEYSAKCEFKGVDEDRHIAAFLLYFYGYNGGGTGAGILSVGKTIYYLYDEQRVMTIDDIISPQGKKVIVRKLNNRPVGIENYNCMNGTAISELPDNFFVEKGILYFTFPKYELACGADGNVTLGVRLSSIKNYLTEMGQSYL